MNNKIKISSGSITAIVSAPSVAHATLSKTLCVTLCKTLCATLRNTPCVTLCKIPYPCTTERPTKISIHRKGKDLKKLNSLLLFNLFFICLLLASCTGTKHLPKGEKLYTGADIEFETSDKINTKQIKRITKNSFRPEPNKSFLGMRPKLWLHMAARKNPNTKLGIWLRKRGEPPVLISSVKPGVTADIIDASLFNHGIFKSYTENKVIEKKNTAKVLYTSYIHKPYKVDDLTFNISDDSISKIILEVKDKSLIKPGEDYNLELLQNERTRIDLELKNQGYFYFNPDYLLFKADTSATDRTISLQLTLKDNTASNALTVYRINQVFIDQNFSLDNEVSKAESDTIHFLNNVFAGKMSDMNIRPNVILESVYLKKGEIYSRHNHTTTLNRLMSMGTFKFVQVRYADSDSMPAGLLNVTLLLSTMTNRTFRSELEIVSKSNNFTGPRMNASLLNRNTFKGAELLNLNMSGSFEAQFGGDEKNLYSYSWNPQVELSFPRFMLPFKIENSKSIYTPKTNVSLSYHYMKRVDYFDMLTFHFMYGFSWKETHIKEHLFNPINVSYSSIRNQTSTFSDLLDSNPFLKKSYEELFIAGMNYSFTYNEQVIPSKKIQYFLQTTAETAGNLFTLANIIGGGKPLSENPSTIIGSVYSQFVKISIDSRGYYNFRNRDRFVMRLYAGVARPYGNSTILPYTRQFFSGGPNSLRAFRINSVGPGTFLQETGNRGFLQLGGDIKLEWNGEYRFTIYRFFKGALFVDAGNVWLGKSNPANEGSPFKLNGFMNELAIGAGAGLRFDVSFFILRFDLAMPLKKPWLEENQRWVTDRINFSQGSWRRENLVFNIAIGYPF